MNEDTATPHAAFYDMIANLADMAAETSWMARGVCAETDPEEFFPDQGESSETAKKVCQGCPARKTCLAYALDNAIPYGVWGGMSAAEREALSPLEVAA